MEDTCRNGHARTVANTYERSNGRTECAACRSVAAAKQRVKRGHKPRAPRAHPERRREGEHPRETLHRVSNAPMRERFLELEALGRTNANRVALALGWVDPREPSGTRGDTTRVKRTLGLMLDEGKYRTMMTYDTAVAFARVLGMDPFEAGV